ncbi:flagellar hook-associated protein FlgK [Desulfovibrio sp. OttesenSCG-928-C14]|nr:flagellar hook-associated protein FlgK [Desulfovibrio sp. OttesenSCG-928-C14]
MASSVNSLLNIGNGALFASQTALHTTGNNIANVNVEGYSRQSVRFETWPSLDFSPGQMGQGVRAAEVLRNFDQFVERSFLNKFSEQSRWSAQTSQLRSVETLFNESTGYGVNKLLQEFYAAWEKLSQFPDDLAAREALISRTKTLSSSLQASSTYLANAEDRVDMEISGQVDSANKLIKEIAELNRQINMHTVPGQNNCNSMLDERDRKVRELAALIDVDVIDKGKGDYIVNTKSGHTLVDGIVSFELYYGAGGVSANKQVGSNFGAELKYSGKDGYEYTVEFVKGGDITDANEANRPQFKVSLDGGRTWITDENGQPRLFTANSDPEEAVRVKDLEIWFNPSADPAKNVVNVESYVDPHGNTKTIGDSFTVSPKNSLYWVEPTIGPINISPQSYADGTDNQQRVTGGAIAGNMIFRDYVIGEVRDKLDQFASSLAWEVNRLHSQGAGLQKLKYALGEYQVRNTGVALGADNSGLVWNEKMQAGNFSIAIYDKDGKPVLADPGSSGVMNINFDPETDSLEDVRNKINAGLAGLSWVDASNNTVLGSDVLEASILDGKLQFTLKNTTDGFSFGFGNDTSGLLAALGINTFFKGNNAATIGVRDEVAQDHSLINAGRINGAAEVNTGDSSIAREIGALTEKKVVFKEWHGATSSQTIGNYYGALVSNVGGKTSASSFQYTTTKVVADELNDRQSEVAGVSLDEEMSNLIRFQASYKAAAKLITTADQMLQTLLGLKQ